jgi:hypothetical protein
MIDIKIILASFILLMLSCDNGDDAIDYANGYPHKMAGNWVVFEFQGATLDGRLSDPYDLVTALSPNDEKTLVLDNLYNSKTRIKAVIQGDTGFVALKTEQLEVINYGGFGIEKVTIDGYINDNYVLKNFVYRLAAAYFENIAFTADDIDEIIFFRAGFYDSYNSLVDTVMVFGYRKTGFEDEDYN